MRLVVLSSFPRSGNTWMRFLLATAMAGGRPGSADLDRMMPDAHKTLAPRDAWLDAPAVVLKSHFTPGALTAYLNQFQASLPDGETIEDLRILHVVRNPFDVAISIAKYYEAPADKFNAVVDAVTNPAVVFPAVYEKWGFSGWAQNTRQWLKASQARTTPIDILRYEDMVADPEAGVANLFDRIGLAPKTSIADCVAQCAPTALRSLEDKERAEGAPGLFAGFHKGKSASARFINGAGAGGFRDRLAPAQIEDGVARLGQLMVGLGYDLDDYRPLAKSA